MGGGRAETLEYGSVVEYLSIIHEAQSPELHSCIHIHTCTHIQTYICLHTGKHTCIHMHTGKHTHTYTHTQNSTKQDQTSHTMEYCSTEKQEHVTVTDIRYNTGEQARATCSVTLFMSNVQNKDSQGDNRISDRQGPGVGEGTEASSEAALKAVWLRCEPLRCESHTSKSLELRSS